MRGQAIALVVALVAAVSGCVSVDSDAQAAREALKAGNFAPAVEWSEELAVDSVYSTRLGMVEAGRVQMLAANPVKAEEWFRQAVDSAVDRKEKAPKIKLSDVGNTVMAATVTDDRTREYYLQPYELNLAIEYGILTQLANGKRDDALADARLAVYVQDSIANTYGADVTANRVTTNGTANVMYAQQSVKLNDVMAGTRNSWENSVLWWLTGVLFEADGDTEMAWQSYRKARAINGENAVFAKAAERADKELKIPARDQTRVVVVYDDGLIPLRESLKVPVPIYTAMSIDLPRYSCGAYNPAAVGISGATNLVSATPAMNVRALAARDLDEQLPGIIVRNLTRAAVQAGAQAAVNAAGNDYAKIAMFVGNAVISAIRRADTRSWTTLPDGQLVWDEVMAPGEYQLGVNAAGATFIIPLSLKAGETKIVWAANFGGRFAYLISR